MDVGETTDQTPSNLLTLASSAMPWCARCRWWGLIQVFFFYCVWPRVFHFYVRYDYFQTVWCISFLSRLRTVLILNTSIRTFIVCIPFKEMVGLFLVAKNNRRCGLAGVGSLFHPTRPLRVSLIFVVRNTANSNHFVFCISFRRNDAVYVHK